jgi:hypothetical protein
MDDKSVFLHLITNFKKLYNVKKIQNGPILPLITMGRLKFSQNYQILLHI